MNDPRPQKKKFEITQAAFFTETIYAENEAEARRKFDRLTTRFVSSGDYGVLGVDSIEIKCPRCQLHVDQNEHEELYKECPHCGLPFEQKSVASKQKGGEE